MEEEIVRLLLSSQRWRQQWEVGFCDYNAWLKFLGPGVVSLSLRIINCAVLHTGRLSAASLTLDPWMQRSSSLISPEVPITMSPGSAKCSLGTRSPILRATDINKMLHTILPIKITLPETLALFLVVTYPYPFSVCAHA